MNNSIELIEAERMLAIEEEKLRTCWRGRMNLYNYVTSAHYTVVLYWRSKVEKLKNY